MDDIILNRKQTLLQGVNINTYGLEIGPSFRPITPKKRRLESENNRSRLRRRVEKNTVNIELVNQKLKNRFYMDRRKH